MEPVENLNKLADDRWESLKSRLTEFGVHDDEIIVASRYLAGAFKIGYIAGYYDGECRENHGDS